MRTLKWILACFGLVLAGLAATVLVKTWTFRSRQFAVPAVPPAAIDDAAAIGRIARAIQIQTVSHDDPSQDDARSFVALRELIDAEFPLIRERLRRTIVHDSSLLYEWKGTDPGRPPIILTAHQDVVPADPSEWKSDPFSGAVTDHVIWGRGALDDKGSLFAILEATEHLLAQGFMPDRTVYLGFGHDEEAGTTGGMNGARSIAAYLKAAGVHAESELDEGGVVLDEQFSMIEGRKLALIGVAEKGFMTLTITAPGQSGHAMMPPTAREVAIFTLARAIREVFPGAVVAPGLITGRTDSLYYKGVADRIYRFAPYLYRRGDEKGPHDRDEFIRTDDYLRMIQFYIRYLQRSASAVERVVMR